MKLNNTFKRELTLALKQKYPKLEIKHEDRFISFKWKEFSPSNADGIEMHWIGLQNGGKGQSTVFRTFGFVDEAKSEFHKKVEKDVLDFSQKFLDDWVKASKELF